MSLPINEGLEKALGCPVVHRKDALAYGQQCRSEALEEAAQVCESENQGWNSDAAAVAATKIRRLK